MRFIDLVSSSKISEADLAQRALNHLQLIFGEIEQIGAFESTESRPDFAVALPDKRVFMFEVKQPRRDFALGVGDIARLVQLAKSSVRNRPVTLFLLTGKRVSAIFEDVLREHGIPVVLVGESPEETLASLRFSSSSLGIQLPRIQVETKH
jgi:hypothetical protein